MTPLEIVVTGTIGGLTAAPILGLALTVQLSMRSLRRRAVWADDATLWGKARTYGRYVYDDITLLDRGGVVGLAKLMAGGAGVGFALAIFGLGLAQLIGPRHVSGLIGGSIAVFLYEVFSQ